MKTTKSAVDIRKISIRQYEEKDREQIIKLWDKCNLTRSWNDPIKDIDRKLTMQKEYFFIAELSSGLAGGLVSGNADGVNAGYNAGRNAVQWNYLNPKEKMKKHKELEKCGTSFTCLARTKMKYKFLEPILNLPH